MRPPAVTELLGVWDAQGHFRLDVTDAITLVAWVKTLEQRNAAAEQHIENARLASAATAAGYDATLAIDAQLVAALDVLAGDA